MWHYQDHITLGRIKVKHYVTSNLHRKRLLRCFKCHIWTHIGCWVWNKIWSTCLIYPSINVPSTWISIYFSFCFNHYEITSHFCFVQDLTPNCPNNILAQNINQHSFFLKSKVIFGLDYIQIVFKCKKRSSENYMCSNKWVYQQRAQNIVKLSDT